MEESRTRQTRFRTGFKGLWDRLRGEHKRIQALNEREADTAAIRDRAQLDRLVFAQLEQRRELRQSAVALGQQNAEQKREIENDTARFGKMKNTPSKAERIELLRSRRKQAERTPSRQRGPDHGMDM